MSKSEINKYKRSLKTKTDAELLEELEVHRKNRFKPAGKPKKSVEKKKKETRQLGNFLNSLSPEQQELMLQKMKELQGGKDGD